MKNRTLLILENDPGLREKWKVALKNCFHIEEMYSEDAVEEALRRNTPNLVLLGTCNAGCQGCLRSVAVVRKHSLKVPIILVAKNGSEELAVAAFRLGVTDYLKNPFTDAQLIQALERNGLSAKPHSDATLAERLLDPQLTEHPLIGHSPAILHLQSYLQKLAPASCNVLITGETGTGKELVAELIHRYSKRRDGLFMCINCAAIPDTLLESELFGYERGAFTGGTEEARRKAPSRQRRDDPSR